MRFMISEKNGCTYTLDGNNGTCLMYHPLYADGTYETNRGAYDLVEWDCLAEDAYDEAEACYALLRVDEVAYQSAVV